MRISDWSSDVCSSDLKPAPIPCLGFEEIIAEKIRAASQRSKIRDLHDLSELATQPLERERIRSLAVLKLWNSGQELDYERFRTRKIGRASCRERVCQYV